MVAVNDPLFGQQWHFGLLGNIGRIWDEFTGAGVLVGVFDDAVQYTHPDLDGNYKTAAQFVLNGTLYDALPVTFSGDDPDFHGTAVAGIIAAEANNGIGGVGVAYGASIVGVKLLSDPAFDDYQTVNAATTWARGLSIMSNSWGYYPDFFDFEQAFGVNNIHDSLLRSFEQNARFGRGGLGTIVVQAAGNDATNACGDSINSSNWVISVAALDENGYGQDYSNFGPNILVSAGAASVTTDLVGINGYSAGNFTDDFGGTSAATPVVSGVIALMLDANEALGWRDVREILANSARLTGAIVGPANTPGTETTYFQGLAQFSNGSIIRNTDTWNDGGRGYNGALGFGRVDAFAAVRLAEVWSLMNGPAKISSNEIVISANDLASHPVNYPSYSTPSGYGTSTVTVSQHLAIEYISVTVDVQILAANGLALSSMANLNLAMFAPDGSYFSLFDNPDFAPADVGNGVTWTYGVSQALGLDAFGEWQVRFEDFSAGYQQHSGSISGLKIKFHGSAWDANNIHHITQDFLLANAVDPTILRDRLINDTNGGTDWLQMATLAGDVILSLVPGRAFSVGGVVWGSIAATTVIENVVTGDGNDRISGNAGANFIYGMRGNDTINGGLGNDKLDGGQGDDFVQGADGNDQTIGGFGHDQLFGGNGNDLIVGGGGFDQLVGEAGNDQLLGGFGNDILNAGAGNDRLESGGGRDIVTGGADADAFVFMKFSGSDFITDFQDNIDTLVLDRVLFGGALLPIATLLASFAGLTSGGVVLNFGGGDTITFTGLTQINALLDDISFL